MEHDLLDEVVLLDEAGEPARFSHILTFLYEGERYIALSPLEEETYVTIESEVLLQEVFAHFLALMDEIQEAEA